MKKISFLLFMFIVVLAGCGSKEVESDGVLTIWSWDPNGNIPILQNASDIYTSINPDVQIDIVEQPNDADQVLHTSLASNTTEGLPDIVMLEDQGASIFLESYPGAFVPLDDYINYDNFVDYKKAVCTFEDQTYCLPFDLGVAGLFYRTDYFAEAGYGPEDLDNITWERYFEISEDVYNKTGHQAIAYDANGVKERIMLQSAGTWYTDERYENLRDNPALVETVEYDKIIRNSDWAYNSPDWASTLGSINSGDLASIPVGNWMISTIKAEESQAGKWGLAPVPRMNVEGAVNYSNDGGASLYVINGTGDEELAADFLSVAFEDESLYQNALDNYGAMLSYIPAIESGIYDTEDEYFGGQKIYEDLSNWAIEVPAVTYGTKTTAAEKALAALTPEYMSGEMTADELLDSIQQQIQ